MYCNVKGKSLSNTLAVALSAVTFLWPNLKPLPGYVQRPNLTAKRLGMAAGHPDLVLKNEGRVFVPRFPAYRRLELLPTSSILGIPNVPPVF